MTVTFLYRNAGGGGERVLWMSIAATQKAFPSAGITLFTSMDGLTGEKICQRAKVLLIFEGNIIHLLPVE